MIGEYKADKTQAAESNSAKTISTKSISSIENEIKELCAEFARMRNKDCYPLFVRDTNLQSKLVDKVFGELRSGNFSRKELDVIIDSSGGSIDAAYNLARLFRRFGSKKLTFVIPRWAKSAATLLVCAGDDILMTPVAELGPLDPQITAMNPLEQRIEEFSPLHIESTLDLIRVEFKNGNSELANGLLQRLQFPLALGKFKKSLELGRQYLEILLTSRMLENDVEKAKEIAKRLTTGYADHSWCITIEETKQLGLTAEELEGSALDITWNMHILNQELEKAKMQEKRNKLKEELKDLPSDLIDQLPLESKNKPKSSYE